MLASARKAEHPRASSARARRDALSPGTSAADLTPVAAWSRRVRWIGGLIQAALMFEAFAGLAAEGKATPRGAPKNPLQLGATVWHFRHESRATLPPVWFQNLIIAPLAVLAKVFGVRPFYERWNTRISAVEPDRLP
jgi:hypothetical protein